MSTHSLSNFSDLYRAAYAEQDPDTKQLLLAAVKRALDRWADSIATGRRHQEDADLLRSPRHPQPVCNT
jgi:hypothetical protein